MSNCKGCGIKLQYDEPLKAGYAVNKDNEYCNRCFKITNYNSHDLINIDINNEELLNKINKLNYATLFLCDILNLNNKNITLYNKIKYPKILVITKMDIIPKNVDLFRLEKKIKSIYKVDDLIFFSIKNNFGKRHIQDYVNFYHNVVISGPTSSGKSSLINHLFNSNITVSNYKNTTQDFINIKVDENNIIDVPGFNDNFMIDNVKQNGFIKPRILMIKEGYSLYVDKYVLSFTKDANITLFLPNNVNIRTMKTKDKLINSIKISNYNDLIINNIGFIYFKDNNIVNINSLDNIDVRESIVGGK